MLIFVFDQRNVDGREKINIGKYALEKTARVMRAFHKEVAFRIDG